MNKQLILATLLMGLGGTALAQSQLETYSVYDVNHQNGITVADAAMVVSRAVETITEDPLVVDVSKLNDLLETVESRLQTLNTIEERISAIEGKIDTDYGPVHRYVDLGMKDTEGRSVYWSICNLGAEKPEDPGLYFAWGETEGYIQDPSDGHVFNWANYSTDLCGGTEFTIKKYCTDSSYGTVDNKDRLEPVDDAAHVSWQQTWRMPTGEEMAWLFNSCTWEWVSEKGKVGYTVTSKETSESIFLPAAGCRYMSVNEGINQCGYYWSSSLSHDSSSEAQDVYFDDGFRSLDSIFRYGAFSIRPVCDSSK